MAAAIRVPSDKDPARRMAGTRSFGPAKREVLALADWLRCWQVPAVVMEATPDYRKGAVLPAGGRGVRLRAGRCAAGQEPARAAETGPGGLPVAGGVLRARRGPPVLRGHRGVPDHPACTPVPAGPGPGSGPGRRTGRRGRPRPAGPPLRHPQRPRQKPGKATGTSSASPARPPPQPTGPRPAKAPAAGGPPPRPAQSPGRPRQHPAEGLPQAAVQPRHPISGPRPGLLRTPARHPPPDRPPRRQARAPGFEATLGPHPRTRTRPTRTTTSRLTRTAHADPARPQRPGFAAACPARGSIFG